MHATKLLVFDLDGTLIDSSLDLCHSVNAALRCVERPELSNSLIASYIGDGAASLVRRALGEPADEGLFERAYVHFLQYYREHKLDHTRCYDGVVEALTAIRARRPALPMAVLTNKPVKPSREICRALGLEPFFFQNYGGNSFATKKPEPEGLLAIAGEASSLLGSLVMPQQIVMIGDSSVDVMTARRCGVRAVGCSFGLAPASLLEFPPDVMVDHPSEWADVVGL
jgi:phosphoglycolate phosphatase